MTAFEDQVTAVLWHSECGLTFAQASALAPRVAAAIEEAVREFAASADDPANDRATWEAAALAALRGGTAGETE